MYSKRKAKWPDLILKQNGIFFVGFIFFSLYNSVWSTGNGGNTECMYFNPSQLERMLRDEGDFDHRFMAADLEGAVDRFSDLADAKFIRKAEVYTCDSNCQQRTDQVRNTFAQYGQMPPQLVPAPIVAGPSFADIRQVLEGHLSPPAAAPPNGQWNGALFPEFHPQNPAQLQPQPVNFPIDSKIPPPSPQPPQPQPVSNQQPFPPLPMDSAFPFAPATFAPHIRSTTYNPADYDDDDDRKTPRQKTRRTKGPQGGMKWLTPGDLDSAMDDFADVSEPTTRRHNRHNRAAPVNSTSIGQGLQIRCSKKGEEEQTGLHLLCGACRVIRELPAEYFPRYLNEVSCSNQTCFDKASPGGGRCVEQFINFDILRNVGTSDCQKWIPHTIAVPVCCSCVMSDQLAQYLNMPWMGQALTTSGPSGPQPR